jgi:recombination protein RecA
VLEGGEGKDRILYGTRHAVQIRKTKIGGRTEVVPTAYFHTSNGVLVPEGFDPARDVLELAEDLGVVEKSGSWYSFEGERVGNGAHASVKRLSENPAMLAGLEKATRAAFAKESRSLR